MGQKEVAGLSLEELTGIAVTMERFGLTRFVANGVVVERAPKRALVEFGRALGENEEVASSLVRMIGKFKELAQEVELAKRAQAGKEKAGG